jgi:hypothetical protein
MPVFAVNQPIATTEPTISVDNKFTSGQHTFQLVVQNSAGIRSDPVTVTVAVGVSPRILTGARPSATAAKPSTQAAKGAAKPAEGIPAKAQPGEPGPPASEQVQQKPVQPPAKKGTRKKSS